MTARADVDALMQRMRSGAAACPPGVEAGKLLADYADELEAIDVPEADDREFNPYAALDHEECWDSALQDLACEALEESRQCSHRELGIRGQGGCKDVACRALAAIDGRA